MPAKKFRFTLQVLLEHRERLEEDAKNIWLRAQAELRQKEDRHRAIGQEVLSARDLRGAWQISSGEDLMNRQFLFEDSLRRLEQAKGEMEAQRKIVEEKREAMILASRDRKAMEILRDKQKEEFKREQNKKEQKFLDELGSSLAARQSQQGGE